MFGLSFLALAWAGLVWASGASQGPVTPPPVTGSWRVSPPPAQREIEGYASQASAAPGDTVELHVSTAPAASYRVELYRIGWYGGSGGTPVGCLPAGCAADEQGAPQPMPAPDPSTGLIRAGWPVTDRLEIPADWRSGYYVAKLVLTSGPDAGASEGVPLVVRPPSGSHSDVLVVAGTNTWQAYNDWGGLSAYTDPRQSVKFSFDRPYAPNDPKLTIDYPVIRFLDQFGYDVSYVTDADLDADPGQLEDHRLVVMPAHSEYWTKAERDALEAARALRVNLAFLGGNTGYWQTRFDDPDRRVLVEYRSASLDPLDNPRQKTVRWRDEPVNRPECSLVGVQWQGGDDSQDLGPHDYRVVAANLRDPWFANTGFKAGDAVKGAVGYEWDSVAPECQGKLPGLTALFHYAGHPTPQKPGVYTSTFHSTDADAVRYVAPSGATVFAAGSIDFGWALTGNADGSPVADGVVDPTHPPDARLQRFMRNAFAAMGAPEHRAG